MKSSRRSRSALALLFALFLSGAAPQQNPSIPSLGETVEVSIVNLDVFVTDKQGKRVRGLTKDDFEILENGRPKPISNFAEYSSLVDASDVTAEAPRMANAAPEQRRTIVVFFEAMKISSHQSKPMMEQLKHTLRSVTRKGDAVSLIVWGGKAQVKADFTDDVESLERALDSVTAAMTGARGDSSLGMREELAATMQFEREVAAAMAAQGTSSAVLDPSRSGEAAAEIHAARQYNEIVRKSHAINAAVNSMAGAEGKKLMLLATYRFGEIAGGEFFYLAGATYPTQQMRDKFGTRELVRSIVENANAAGVTIYPIFPAGLADAGGTAATTLQADPRVEHLVLMNETISLREIAEKTGGLLATSAGDVVKLLPRIEEDVNDYYSLAYRVDSSRKDAARNVVVRTKNRDLVVRARRQFVEKSDETRMKDRVTATLFQNFEQSSFRIGAELGARQKKGRNELLPLKVRIPIKALTLLPQNGKHAGAFSVFVVSAASMGEVSPIERQTKSFEIAEADLQRALAGHFTYNFDLLVTKKIDRVAVGVLDEVSKSYSLLRVDLAPSAD